MTEAPATEAATTPVATTEAAAPVTEAVTAAAAPATATEAATPPATTAAPAETTTTEAAAAPDWRTKYAGDDKEALKRLARFADEASFFKSYRSLEQKLSSGELKEPRKELAKDAKPEEVAAWRKENGIPENETGYIEALKLPEGVVMGDADKPIAESFAKAALNNNWSPKQYNDAVAWYYDYLVEARERIDERDETDGKKTEDVLRTDWGGDYRRNTNAITNFLETLPDELHIQSGDKRIAGGMLLAARLPDGTLLGRNVAAMRGLAQWALDANPAATIIPSGGGDSGQSVESRLKQISDLRRSGSEEFRTNRKQLEAEEIKLLEVKTQLQKRGRAA